MLSRITMILRGYNLEEVDFVAQVLLKSKHIRNMEITLNTDNAYEIIKEISSKYGNELNVGAGTVQTFGELQKAVESGATFALSPRKMDATMLAFCQRNNIVSIPGSFSASEVAESYHAGADIIKIFPANEVSMSYAKKLKEPMGDIPMMAVGGINASNVAQALEGGYDYIGSAGGIFKKDDIKSFNKVALEASLEEFDAAVDAYLNK